MNKKSITYALLIGAIVIVGLMVYEAVFSSDDAQDEEKAYELQAAEITAKQFGINQVTRKIFDSNLETSQCYIIKMAYDDTEKNYYNLASLTAPLEFQYRHEMLLDYLNNTYQMWLTQYDICTSDSESDKRYYYGESATYGLRATKLLMDELTPWSNEWAVKYPKEMAVLYTKYHP